MHRAVGRAEDCVFHRMRRRSGARRPGDTIDSSEKRADFEGERFLLLSVRRIVSGRGDCRVVHLAVAVFGSVRRWFRGVLFASGLWYSRIAKKQSLESTN